MATIYKIQNPLGETYIGSTARNEIRTRKSEHKYSFKKGKKSILYSSFHKHGFENHSFEEICKVSKEDSMELEHFIIQELNASLNEVVDYNATATGKIWVNNGVQEVQIYKNTPLPCGYVKGRKKNKKLGRRPYKN